MIYTKFNTLQIIIRWNKDNKEHLTYFVPL